LPSAWGSALGKEVVCRVPVVWHSAKHRALGIYAVSGSGMWDVELTTKPELEVASKPDIASIAAPTEQEQ